METIQNGRRTEYVYSPGEYTGEVVYWRDCTSTGQHVRTDDDYVLKVLRHEIIGGRMKLRFIFGSFWANRRPMLWGELRKKKVVTWIDMEARSRRVKNAVASYVGYMIARKEPDWDHIGKIYRPDQKIPAATVRRLFRQPLVKEMISAEMKKALSNLDIDPDYILKRMKEVVESARNSSDLTNMRLQLRDLAEMLEMFPQKSGFAGDFDPARLPTADATFILDENEEKQAQIAAHNILGDTEDGLTS